MASGAVCVPIAAGVKVTFNVQLAPPASVAGAAGQLWVC